MTATHSNEKHLLTRLKEGDDIAFQMLYDQHKKELTAVLLKLLKADELVQDTLQDVFLKLWEYRPKIDPERPLAPLLHRIARNNVTDLFRRAYRDISLSKHLIRSGITLAEKPVDARIIAQEELAILHSAIEKLPPRQREVFTLHKIEGKSYNEISELLGIGHDAIAKHIYRATQTLKETLNPAILLTLAIVAGVLYLL